MSPLIAGTRLSLMQELGQSLRYKCLAIVMPSSPQQSKALRLLLVLPMQEVASLNSANAHQERKLENKG